jgi:SAM-dependent methyltransferase
MPSLWVLRRSGGKSFPAARPPGRPAYGRQVPDAIFADPRLAAVYDAFDGPRDDLDAYLGVARETGARRVLDVGCGTGCLAVRLAAAGLAVTGADPSAASLDIARAKDRRVTWVLADAAAVPAVGADLAVMTGNVAQVFLGDDDCAAALAAIRAALRPGGYLAFETRRPEFRAWREWAARRDPVTLDVPGAGLVEQRCEVTSVALPLVSFRYTYRFRQDGTVITSDSTLRFRSQAETQASLAQAGYRVLDVREAPDRPGRELVFLAERAA